MKVLLCLFLLKLIPNAFSAEKIPLPEIKFVIKVSNGITKIEDSLKYPENFLRKYKPQGAKITDLVVSHNTVTFIGTKTYMFVSHSVRVKATLDSKENKLGCKSNEYGSDLLLSFDGSDGLVYENFDSVTLKLCAQENKKSELTVSLKPVLVKGNAYSAITGPFVQSIVEAQIMPIVQAVESVVTAK